MDIDSELLSNDDNVLYAFASDTKRCVVVDWRDDERELIQCVINAVPEAGLTFAEDQSGEDLVLSYKGMSVPVGLTMSPKDRYITIRAINRILDADYQMRLFRVTYESDTHSFYVKPVDWWREAEAAYPLEIERVFRVVDETMDFH